MKKIIINFLINVLKWISILPIMVLSLYITNIIQGFSLKGQLDFLPDSWVNNIIEFTGNYTGTFIGIFLALYIAPKKIVGIILINLFSLFSLFHYYIDGDYKPTILISSILGLISGNIIAYSIIEKNISKIKNEKIDFHNVDEKIQNNQQLSIGDTQTTEFIGNQTDETILPEENEEELATNITEEEQVKINLERLNAYIEAKKQREQEQQVQVSPSEEVENVQQKEGKK